MLLNRTGSGWVPLSPRGDSPLTVRSCRRRERLAFHHLPSSEGIELSQQPLFVPASPGWYACPGDPPGIGRHWDGKKWLCEIRGPIRDHFDFLRAMSAEGLCPADQALLRQLTNEVSAIEDLVLARPTANPPLVQIAAPPPYVPPPIDPYTSTPLPTHAMPGASHSTANGQRFAAPEKRRGGWGRWVIAVVGVLVLIAGYFGLSTVVTHLTASPPATAALAVDSCVTLSHPSGSNDQQDMTWTPSQCQTPPGGPVSYKVVSKLAGAAACDTDSQHVQQFTSTKTVASTYCLMENLTVGQCLYQDAAGFYFDVACTDERASIKVAVSVEQGADYQCLDGTQPWQFPAGNRTYCLQKP